MKKNNSLKSIILKTVFVFMSVMYLLSPVQTELYSFIHKISHQLESKFSRSESHQHHAQSAESHHHEHEFSHLHEVSNAHHHKKVTKSDHSHQILSFLNAVFNADDSDNTNEKFLVESKLDKHIIPITVINPEELPSITTLKIWLYTLKIDQMGFDVNTPPPKTYFI